MLWRQAQRTLRFLELVHQLLDLFFQITLELEELSDGLGLVLRLHGVELAAATQHGLFHLLGNDRTDFPQVGRLVARGWSIGTRPPRKAAQET